MFLRGLPLAATVACSTPIHQIQPQDVEAGELAMLLEEDTEEALPPAGTVEGRLLTLDDATYAVPDALQADFDRLAASSQLAGSAMATWLRLRSLRPEDVRIAQNTTVRRFLIPARPGRSLPPLPGWRVLTAHPLLHGVVATPEVPAAMQALLARTLALPDLANVEEETKRSLTVAAGDPQYASLWSWPKIKADLAHDRFASVPGTLSVAVLDTGVHAEHPDLVNQMQPREAGDNMTTYADGDRQSHGTHVAGTLAAERHNGVGVAGVAPQARILDIKVLGDNGSGSNVWVAHGILRAVARGAKVLNLSLGSTAPSEAERTAIGQALTQLSSW
ncbi:MAG: S8 family serine peptidase [Candidatus Sericytochromatia bacterium]|nr:S8 family serine peptidase [Candidatus Sericytochromatia bacterium]